MNDLKEKCEPKHWDSCRVEKMGCEGCHYTDMPYEQYEKAKLHCALLTKIQKLYQDKNHDYGDSVSKTFDEYGLTSFLVRMDDKMNRIKTLNKTNDIKVRGEKLEDTLLDLANYALLAIVEIQYRANELLKEPDDGWDNIKLNPYKPKHAEEETRYDVTCQN